MVVEVVTGLALLALAAAQVHQTPFKTVFLTDAARTEGAVCLDGTPGGEHGCAFTSCKLSCIGCISLCLP